MRGNQKAAHPGTYKFSVYRLIVYFGFMIMLLCERKLCKAWKHSQWCHCLRVQEVTCFDCAISSVESMLFEVAFDFPPACCSFEIVSN